MIETADRPAGTDAAAEAMSRLARLEQAIGGLSAAPERAALAADVAALRGALTRLSGLEQEARRRLEHDVRVPLNAIAGWTHILKTDPAAAGSVARAVDVFDRNVRAATRVIEAYAGGAELFPPQR